MLFCHELLLICRVYLSRIRTPNSDGGFYERAFARLEGQGPAQEKIDAEVELLKVQARVFEKDVALKEASAIGAAIANKGAKIANKAAAIANLKTIMEIVMLTEEQMAECRNKLFILGME
jgi:hypothetical protein